jgi:hypothetical protein
VKPLNDLIAIKGNMMSFWKDDIHGKAIRGIKHALTTQPVMMLPDPAGEFRIHVDSCTEGYGCGAILLQRDPRWRAWRDRQDARETVALAQAKEQAEEPPTSADTDPLQPRARMEYADPKLRPLSPDKEPGWRPVAYWSQNINRPEPIPGCPEKTRRVIYSATEAEALGMHNSIMHWAPYLLNGRNFTVVVDHQALVYFSKGQGDLTNPRLNKMMLNLQGYRFSVLYRDGKKHVDADAISRLLRFDTLGDIHLLEEGTPCRTMDKGLEISLIRKIMLDREFFDPGRDLDPPPLPPAKTRRG